MFTTLRIPLWLRYVSAAVTGLFIGWIFLPTPLWTCGIYRSGSAPAWVQAVGSIVAILAAAIIAWWQVRQHDARAAEATAKRMIIVRRRLVSNLRAVMAEMNNEIGRISRMMPNPSEAEINDYVMSMYLTSTNAITHREDDFQHLSFEAVKHLVTMLEHAEQHTEQYSALYNMTGPERFTEFNKVRSSIKTRLENLDLAASGASSAITVEAEKLVYGPNRDQKANGSVLQ